MITVHNVPHGSSFDDLVRESFALDASTGILYWKRVAKNHNQLLGKSVGYVRTFDGWPRHYVKLAGKAMPRARVVFFLHYGYWPMPKADHINRNQMDDRPSNLREASHMMNNHNHRRNNVRLTSSGRYQARLGQKSLGTFATREAAVNAYNEARTILWQT